MGFLRKLLGKFGQSKQKRDKTKERFETHYNKVEGSTLSRCVIGLAMAWADDEKVINEVRSYSKIDRATFLMTWESSVMWCIQQALDAKGIMREEIQSQMTAIQHYYAKHAVYEPNTFEVIFNQTRDLLDNMKPAPETGVIWPIAYLIAAAGLSGRSLTTPPMGFEFGMYVALSMKCIMESMEKLVDFAQKREISV